MSKKRGTVKVPVALPEQAAGAHWLRGIRVSGFTILTLGMIVLFIVVLAPSLRVLVEQQQEIAALKAALEQQEEQVADLEDERARWSDPHYVETQARERLYYVKPGEYSYLVIDDGATVSTPGSAPISDELQTTEVDWLTAMLGSVLTAGLTDAPPELLDAPVVDGASREGTP